MRGAVPPLPQYAFMAWCLVKKITGTTLRLPAILAPALHSNSNFLGAPRCHKDRYALESLKIRVQLVDLVTNGRIISTWILEKQVAKGWTALNWLRIRSEVGGGGVFHVPQRLGFFGRQLFKENSIPWQSVT
jgi:hypothetical protein